MAGGHSAYHAGHQAGDAESLAGFCGEQGLDILFCEKITVSH